MKSLLKINKKSLLSFTSDNLIFLGFSFFSLSWSSSSFAQVMERIDDRLILKDRNCERLMRAQISLKRWTEHVHPGRICERLSTINNSGSTCSVDVTNCVPDHVENYQGLHPEKQGPNCWNLSLVMKEILPGLRYSTPEEMSFYMRPPLCRLLKNNEKRQPGDVGAIRAAGLGGAAEDEIHGFIYISDDLVYSKNGFSKQSAYEVQSFSKMLDLYDVPNNDDCRKNSGNNKKCSIFTAYYRCDSMNDYLKQQTNLSLEVKASLKNLNSYEQCLEMINIGGGMLSENSLSTIENSLNALTKYVVNESQKNKRQNKVERLSSEDFILASIHLRIKAISEQFIIINHKETDRAIELSQMFEQNYKKFEKTK